MSGYLLDTNVVSELRKGARAEPNVLRWCSRIPKGTFHLSVISLAEIDRGIAMLGKRDAVSAAQLELWRNQLVGTYRQLGQLHDVTEAIGKVWAELMCLRTVPVLDGFLAATAMVYGLTLATRNEADFKGLPVKVENPWVV